MFKKNFLKFYKYLTGYFSQLMIFLLLLFVFRPNNWGLTSTAIWELFFTGVFISSIFNVHHPKPIKILACCLSIPALLFDWLTLFDPIWHFIIASLIFTILFLAICTASILYNVVLRARVTLETLRGVICAYFMIGFVFSFIYLLIEFLHPGSFKLIQNEHMYVIHSGYLSQMMYFSYITLLTIGFGDITPLTNFAQSFVVIEGVIGQFYIAILVARIVSVYTLFSDKALLDRLESAIKNITCKLK